MRNKEEQISCRIHWKRTHLQALEVMIQQAWHGSFLYSCELYAKDVPLGRGEKEYDMGGEQLENNRETTDP